MEQHYNLTLEEVEGAIREYFKDIPQLTYAEVRSRVLRGYSYRIQSPSQGTGRELSLLTGQGGVFIYLEKCEEAGVPAFHTAGSIICNTNEGPYPLSQLKIKQNE